MPQNDVTDQGLLCFPVSQQVLDFSWTLNTLQPIYNTVCYNMVLDITWFKDGSQKCIDYIEKWSFFNIIYTCLFGYNTVA